MTRAERRLLALALVLLALAVNAAPRALASEGEAANGHGDDDDDARNTAPELIQLYESQALDAELRLPGLWTVSDTPDGVRAVEPDQPRPAALELGALDLPGAMPAAALADAVVAELARKLPRAEVKTRAPLPAADANQDRFYLELDATEHDTTVRYALLVVTSKRRAFVASLAAPPERFDAFVPRDLLGAVVDSID